MKRTILFFAVLLVSMSNFAQTNDYIEMSRTVLKAETKEVIAGVMTLSEAQSTPFWEIYNEYQAQNYTVQNKRIAIIKDYSDNYENLSDEKANELVNQSFAYQIEDIKLKKKYYKKMTKVVPAVEAAKFIQAISKIDDLVNAQLALEIPLIETK